MDYTNNRDNNNDQPRHEDWQDPAFGWEEMKDGIFDKILEEDPHFFEEKRRRRVPVWFWFGAAAMVLGGAALWQLSGNGQKDLPPPPHSPKTAQPAEQAPVAGDSRPAIFENEKTETHEARTDIFSNKKTEEKTDQTNNLNKVKTQVHQAASPSENVANSGSDHMGLNHHDSQNHGDLAAPPAEQVSTLNLLPILSLKNLKTAAPHLAISDNKTESPSDNSDQKDGQPKAPWKISVTGGALFSFSKYGGHAAAVGLRNDHTSPVFGYRYGLDAWMPLGQKDYLLIGLDRLVAWQNIDIFTERQFDTLLQNIALETTHYIVGNRTSSTQGDTLVTATQKNRLVKYNNFRSMQVQVGYARVFSFKKWHFSPFAGLSAGLLTYQDGWSVATDRSIFPFGNEPPILRRFQLKTIAGAEVERQLAGRYSLVFRYHSDQQWNNASLEDGISWKPVNHYFSLGVARRW